MCFQVSNASLRKRPVSQLLGDGKKSQESHQMGHFQNSDHSASGAKRGDGIGFNRLGLVWLFRRSRLNRGR